MRFLLFLGILSTVWGIDTLTRTIILAIRNSKKEDLNKMRTADGVLELVYLIFTAIMFYGSSMSFMEVFKCLTMNK